MINFNGEYWASQKYVLALDRLRSAGIRVDIKLALKIVDKPKKLKMTLELNRRTYIMKSQLFIRACVNLSFNFKNGSNTLTLFKHLLSFKIQLFHIKNLDQNTL